MQPLTQDILLTRFDHRRLQGLLRVFRKRCAVNPWNLDALELELSRARTVAADAIPSDVITMNSRFILRDLVTGERTCRTLVFPDALALDDLRVSILSPLGLALLGCRAGDTLDHFKPGNPLHIEAVEYQPEAKGNFFT
jgi:regulator of nucleoside diphosphate kinase